MGAGNGTSRALGEDVGTRVSVDGDCVGFLVGNGNGVSVDGDGLVFCALGEGGATVSVDGALIGPAISFVKIGVAVSVGCGVAVSVNGAAIAPLSFGEGGVAVSVDDTAVGDGGAGDMAGGAIVTFGAVSENGAKGAEAPTATQQSSMTCGLTTSQISTELHRIDAHSLQRLAVTSLPIFAVLVWFSSMTESSGHTLQTH